MNNLVKAVPKAERRLPEQLSGGHFEKYEQPLIVAGETSMLSGFVYLKGSTLPEARQPIYLDRRVIRPQTIGYVVKH